MEQYKAFKKNLTFPLRFQYGFYQFMDHFFGRKRFFSKGRKKFYDQVLENLKKNGEGKIMPIERRKDLSLDEFKNHYAKKGIPVILEGAAKDWDCVKKWSLDYFKDLHGKDEIILVESDEKEFQYEITTLEDVINNIGSGGSKYYRFYPLLVRHPEHIKDFDIDWLKKRKNSLALTDAFQVFIGGKGTVSGLHNANQSNLFVQTYGEKEWILYSHYYTTIIDPAPIQNLYRISPRKKTTGSFDPFNPDFTEQYELFKYLDGYSVHLKPGDVLWNPPFYWHAVKNVTDSIGVGYRWSSPFYSFKISPFYMFLDCFATNPPIWKSFKLYKKDMNELHLAEVKKLEDAKRAMKKQ